MDDKTRTVTRMIPGNDPRLNVSLSEYDILPDTRAIALLSGLKKLSDVGKICVGHLVSMNDAELSFVVGAHECSALRDWQEAAIGIARDTKVFGWRAPTAPFHGF